MWRRAQFEVDRHAREAPPSPYVLRTTGFLAPELAAARHRLVHGGARARPPTPSGGPTGRSSARPRGCSRSPAATSGSACDYVRGESEPYRQRRRALRRPARARVDDARVRRAASAARSMAFDQLRVVHDVFGHAALGLGFDLQSEFATWLQCRTLFSADARPAAFCELVGAVTAYITTGEKPGLQAKLPPAELLAASRLTVRPGCRPGRTRPRAGPAASATSRGRPSGRTRDRRR